MKKTNFIPMIASLLIGGTIGGTAFATDDTSPAGSTENKVSAPTKLKREFYVFKANMESKLKEVDADIEKLESKARETKTEVKSDVDSRLAELKVLRGEINSELKDMSETTRDQYSKFKSTIQSKYEELSNKTKETARKITK